MLQKFEDFVNEGKTIKALISVEDHVSNNPVGSRGALKSFETLYNSQDMRSAKEIGTYQDFKDGKLGEIDPDKIYVKIDLPKW